MYSVISIILSILIAIFPFLGSLENKSDFTDDLQIITMAENGNDIILKDENGETVSEDEFSSDEETTEVENLPSAYDARNDNLITSVKSQGNSGCCWAFAAISAAETNMIKQDLAENNVDYSEAHLVWFGLRTLAESKKDSTYGDGITSDSPFEDGGNWARSVFALARWAGVEKEENFPLDGFPYPEGNYPESERYNSYAHLQNSSQIPADDQDGIKQAILDCGCITASYYHSSTFLKNDGNEACYYQSSVTNTNHTVTIIGWDDNYSKENFKKTPESDGAWLVKNSWGSTWGENGYFWLSYCDTSLSYFTTFEMESADNYENINQYDGFGYKGWGYLSGYNQMSMANVFTTKAKETIKAVSFYTVQQNVSYTVEVYTDVPIGGNPTDGTLATSESGFMKYRGYKTVSLSNAISLPQKSRYSVVVTFTVPEGENACIPLEYPEGYDGAHIRSYYAQEGQSYLTISREFDEWEDTAAEGYNNVCIKTFSDNDSLRLKDITEYVLSGGALGYVSLGTDDADILSQFRNKNIEISNKSVVLLNENGEIIDSAEIAYLGDIDNDGDIDYYDYELLYSFAFVLKEPTKREWFSSDINKNRKVEADDVGIMIMTIMYS